MITWILGASLASAATTSEMDRARLEMNAAAANMVNAETTRTPEGGCYRYRRVACAGSSCAIVSELRERVVHEPTHPDADERGDVHYPAIDVEFEKSQMRAAISKYDRLQRVR